MVNSLELILDEIYKAKVKLGKKTGRIALNIFEYQKLIELSFNGRVIKLQHKTYGLNHFSCLYIQLKIKK